MKKISFRRIVGELKGWGRCKIDEKSSVEQRLHFSPFE